MCTDLKDYGLMQQCVDWVGGFHGMMSAAHYSADRTAAMDALFSDGSKLEASLKQLHGEEHQGIMINDFRTVSFDMSPPSDGLIGTSPCADFSLLGTNDKIGFSDKMYVAGEFACSDRYF